MLVEDVGSDIGRSVSVDHLGRCLCGRRQSARSMDDVRDAAPRHGTRRSGRSCKGMASNGELTLVGRVRGGEAGGVQERQREQPALHLHEQVGQHRQRLPAFDDVDDLRERLEEDFPLKRKAHLDPIPVPFLWMDINQKHGGGGARRIPGERGQPIHIISAPDRSMLEHVGELLQKPSQSSACPCTLFAYEWLDSSHPT